MYKMFAVAMTCLLALVVFACTSSPSGNSANTNSNGSVNIDKGNLPPGLSGNAVPVNGTTPGIPAPGNININMNVKGTPPIPGIDPVNANKVPRGVTPTPGIPSPEEIKKMMKMRGGNQAVNMEANTPPAGPVMRRENMKQMEQRKKPGN